jgi:hypothetical protein
MDCKISETVQTLLQTETFILGFILISQKIRMNKVHKKTPSLM